VIEDSRLYLLLGRFFSCIYRGADEIETETAMIEALSWLILHYTSLTKDPEEVRDENAVLRTVELIQDTVQHSLSLAILAQEAGMSKYHYLRTFKRYTGLTPHQYSLSVRIQKATERIISEESIVQASVESGFSDQSHFTRHFKRIYGYTPYKIIQESNIVLYR
jgi:AraC-like DNA-binding protein